MMGRQYERSARSDGRSESDRKWSQRIVGRVNALHRFFSRAARKWVCMMKKIRVQLLDKSTSRAV